METRNNRLQLNNLPMGITYIKVQSIDNLGLKGPFSEVMMRVIRNEDTKAPPIFGSAFEGNIFFTSTKTVTLEGTTEPDAKVTVDGKAINVSASGSFSTIVQIASNDETVEIKATDNSKNTTTKRLRIAELNENYLFNIKLNGSKISSTIRPSTSPVTITGLAYPEMEVELKNEDNVKIVKTDSQGRWGVTMSVQQGKLSVTFKTNQKDTATLNINFIRFSNKDWVHMIKRLTLVLTFLCIGTAASAQEVYLSISGKNTPVQSGDTRNVYDIWIKPLAGAPEGRLEVYDAALGGAVDVVTQNTPKYQHHFSAYMNLMLHIIL